MNRYEEFGMSLAVQPLDVFLIAVAGSVHEVFPSCAVTNDFHPLSGQTIFHFLNLKFIARNDGSWKDNRITFMQWEFGVSFISGSVERGEFFTLRSSHQDNYFVRRIVINLLDRYDGAFFRSEESCFYGDFNVCFHRASIQRYFFALWFGKFNHMSEASDVGSESSDDDAATHFADQVFQTLVNFGFG